MRVPAHSIVAALPMPAVLISADERVAAVNALAKTLLGADIAGRHYITALRQPSVLDAVERCLSDGKNQSATYLSSQAQQKSTWQVLAAVVDDPPRQAAVLLTFTDLTNIEQADQMRRDFVSNVSHELRTPLTSVLGFVETLRGAAKSDPVAQDRFLYIIDQEAKRMARLVDDLLSLARVEDQARRKPVDVVTLQPLIQSVITSLVPLAQASEVLVQHEVPTPPVSIVCDAAQLRQIVSNLIENAIKYGGSKRNVHVTLTAPKGDPSLRVEAIRLTVRDEGPGIPEHFIPRLTERFYRLDNHRSRELGGTGLGLAIVKHIINRHRGRLRIDSKLGEGATFTVVLPVS